MNIIQFLFLTILLNNILILNGKYLLVEIKNEKVDKMDLESHEASSSHTENNLIAPKNPGIQSRGNRIIGGKEIRPHSQPWLALVCGSDSSYFW